MSTDLLVRLSVHEAVDGDWFVEVRSRIRLQNCYAVCVAESYKTRKAAIKAAKKLLPLFVNAYLK